MSETLSEAPTRVAKNGRPRCQAMSKQTRQLCKKWAHRKPDGTYSRNCAEFHSGKREGVPNEERKTHGYYSPYIHVDDLDKVGAVAAALESTEGKRKHLNKMTAVESVKADKVSDDEVLLRFHDAMRKNIETTAKLDELERAATAPASAAITFVDFGSGGPDLLRGPTGPVRALRDPDDAEMRLIELSPGTWVRARGHIGTEGEETWKPVLQLPEAQP